MEWSAEGNPCECRDDWTAQEILRDPQQLAMSFMNAPNVGVAICGLEFRYRGVNDALARMNGIPAVEHLGRTVSEVLGGFAEKVEPLFQHVIFTGKPALCVHVTGSLPKRAEPGHWIENYFPLKDAKGNVERLCAVVVEVTEQKKLEKSLQDLNSKGNGQLKELVAFHKQLLGMLEPSELVAGITGFVNQQIPHDYAVLTLKDEALRWFERESTQLSVLREPAWHQIQGQGVESVYDIPLVTQRSVLGTLHLASRGKDAFRELNQELAERVAMQIALALDYTCVSRENETLKSKLAEQHICVEVESKRGEAFQEILGDSPALEQVLHQARIVANTDATVLILGETGTGKELVARGIHRASRRREQNFVKINCAAIPAGLLESELFGYEKAAFTGAASQKIGRLEWANGGTLLLDEIGDLPLEVQPKLLRVIQHGEFERLGGTRTIRVNVRLIAATNRNLAQKVAEHCFRSDLFYRLNVFPIRMPALRERKEDIPVLVRHFVKKYNPLMDKNVEEVSRELMDQLQAADWVGNVRELEHIVERLMILTCGSVLRGRMPNPPEASPAVVERTLQAVERDCIVQTLRKTRGQVAGINGAAAKLGLKRTTLQSKLLKLKIRPSEFRELAESAAKGRVLN